MGWWRNLQRGIGTKKFGIHQEIRPPYCKFLRDAFYRHHLPSGYTTVLESFTVHKRAAEKRRLGVLTNLIISFLASDGIGERIGGFTEAGNDETHETSRHSFHDRTRRYEAPLRVVRVPACYFHANVRTTPQRTFERSCAHSKACGRYPNRYRVK